MALDFGVENEEYKKALEDIRQIKLPASYWDEVSSLIEDESKKASESVKSQQVDDELLHRCFSL